MTVEVLILLFGLSFLGPLFLLFLCFRDHFLLWPRSEAKVIELGQDPQADAATNFVHCIRRCKKFLYIVAGLGHPKMYTPEVAQALREIAADNGRREEVKIKIDAKMR